MKKLMGPIALSAVACFGLYACLTSSGGGGGSSKISFQYDLDVLSNTAPTTSVPGKIIVRSIDSYCNASGVVVKDTSVDTSFYAIAGGKLYLWEKGDCVAGTLSGSSTTIVGTWTSTSVGGDNIGERALVPAAYRASTCPSTLPADSSDNDFGDIIENASVTINISASKISEQLSGNVCFAKAISESYSEDDESPITVTSSTCSSVSLKNTLNQKTLTISSSLENNVLSVSYKSGSKTCTMSSSFPVPGSVPDCSEPQFGEEDSTFTTCMMGLDFYSSAMAKKNLSRDPEIVKSFQKSLRSFRPRD